MYTVICGTFSSFFLLNFSRLLSKTGIFGKYLAWLGRNSITVFFVHLVYMAAAKQIVGADLNPSLAYVSEMSGRDLLAFALTVVLVSLHVFVSDRILKSAANAKK